MAGPFQLDFVGVGAARSGTTWLARCLDQHPAIWMPPEKELHYFNNDRQYEPTLSRLRQVFAEAPAGAVRGEFTPRYLIRRTALERINDAFPQAKILVCLRDPVARAYSQYCYFRFNKRKEPEVRFDEALTGFYREDYLDKSLYAEALEALFAIVGRERVHVTLFDDICERPRDVLQRIFAFLSVDAAFVPPSAEATVNASGGPAGAPSAIGARLVRWLTYSRALPARATRHALGGRVPPAVAGPSAGAHGEPRAAPVDSALRAKIFTRHFAADVEATERLLGRDLSAWKHADGGR